MRRPSIPLSRPNGRGQLGSVSKIFPPVRPPPLPSKPLPAPRYIYLLPALIPLSPRLRASIIANSAIGLRRLCLGLAFLAQRRRPAYENLWFSRVGYIYSAATIYYA